MSQYKPITYPAWTYKSLANAYHIQFDNFEMGSITVTNIAIGTAATTLVSTSTVFANPWMELVMVVNGVAGSTAATTINLMVMLDGTTIATVTVGTGGYSTMSAAVTSTVYSYYSSYFGIGLTPGAIATGTHTIAIMGVSSTANTLVGISGYPPTLAMLGGNIVIGSGYHDHQNGSYSIPTLSGSEIKQFRVYTTNYGVQINSGSGGAFLFESKNLAITYLSTQSTTTIVNVESLCEYQDTSSVLQIQKLANGSPEYVGVLVSIDIEEGDQILQEYPFSNITPIG